MKALEIKLVDQKVTYTINFFSQSNVNEATKTVFFDNGYKISLKALKSDLANGGAFGSYKDEKAFLSTWKEAKLLDFINNNITLIAASGILN